MTTDNNYPQRDERQARAAFIAMMLFAGAEICGLAWFFWRLA